MDIKILLIEPNETVGDLIKQNLEREFNAKVHMCKTGAEAALSIKKNEFFDLYISRNQTEETPPKEGQAIASLVLNALYDNSLTKPLIVIGEFEHSLKKFALVCEQLRIEEINRLVLKALNLKKEEFSHLKMPEYLPFPTSHFYLMNLCPCDVYIKLTKRTGEEFVRRLRFGEAFTKEDLKKYEEVGLKEFFVKKDDRELFLNGLLTQSLKNLRVSHEPIKAVEVTGDSFVLSADLLKSLGITPACVAMVDQTIAHMRTQITKSDKLGVLLKKLLDNQMSFSYRRSYMINLISFTLLPKMEWGSTEQQQMLLEKISMVSFFHDIYLEDDAHLKIMSKEDVRLTKLNPRERDLILNHANKAALLIQNYPKLPSGVDQIIKQHHGVSNGVGFPEVLSTSISPMAIFFIVVEDFVTQVLENQDLAHIPVILADLKLKYTLPTYRKILTEIESIFKKK